MHLQFPVNSLFLVHSFVSTLRFVPVVSFYLLSFQGVNDLDRKARKNKRRSKGLSWEDEDKVENFALKN